MDVQGNEMAISGHCKEKSESTARVDGGNVTCNEFKTYGTTTKNNTTRELFYQGMNDHIERQNIPPAHTSVAYSTTNNDHGDR